MNVELHGEEFTVYSYTHTLYTFLGLILISILQAVLVKALKQHLDHDVGRYNLQKIYLKS